MKRFLATVALAGCTSTVTLDDPCACVIIPDINGAISAAFGDAAVLFDGEPGTGADTSPITGTLGTSFNGQGIVTHDISVDGRGGIFVAARMAAGARLVAPARATVTDLYFETSLRADTEFADSESYGLGPEGGTMQLREIVEEPGGGFRLRGGYDAQACPEDPASGAPCVRLSGNFAFSVPSLPPETDPMAPTG